METTLRPPAARRVRAPAGGRPAPLRLWVAVLLAGAPGPAVVPAVPPGRAGGAGPCAGGRPAGAVAAVGGGAAGGRLRPDDARGVPAVRAVVAGPGVGGAADGGRAPAAAARRSRRRHAGRPGVLRAAAGLDAH